MRREFFFLFVFIGLAMNSVTAPDVAAQTGTGGTGARPGTGTGQNTTPVSGDFFLRLMKPRETEAKVEPGAPPEPVKWTIFTDFDKKVYFNQARCRCGSMVRLELDLSTAGAAKRTQFVRSQANVQVLIGEAGCVAAETSVRSAAKCEILRELKLADLARAQARTTIDFPMSLLYGLSGGECTRRGQQAIRLRIDETGDGIPDLVGSEAPFVSVDFDGEPPAPPTGVQITPGNESLEISWETNRGVADFRGFVVLCSRGESTPVYKDSLYDKDYRTVQTECGGNDVPPATFDNYTQGVTPTGAALIAQETAPELVEQAQTTEADGGAPRPYPAPVHFQKLDAAYVCSELLLTQTSTRLRGLQNAISYLVGVATIDLHGNPSEITRVYLEKPIATRDFYNGYRGSGGDAEGGYCALGGRRSSSGVLGLFVVALAALAGRRLARRRR